MKIEPMALATGATQRFLQINPVVSFWNEAWVKNRWLHAKGIYTIR